MLWSNWSSFYEEIKAFYPPDKNKMSLLVLKCYALGNLIPNSYALTSNCFPQSIIDVCSPKFRNHLTTIVLFFILYTESYNKSWLIFTLLTVLKPNKRIIVAKLTKPQTIFRNRCSFNNKLYSNYWKIIINPGNAYKYSQEYSVII